MKYDGFLALRPHRSPPRTKMIRCLGLGIGLCLLLLPGGASGQSGQPARFQAQYTKLYSEDFEGTHPGIQLLNWSCPPSAGCSAITPDSSQVIGGKASLRLTNFGRAGTDPKVLALGANTTYIVEFQYRILNYGTSPNVLQLHVMPAGSNDAQKQVNLFPLLPNAPATGTFSVGAQVAEEPAYMIYVAAGAQADVVIDNLTLFRRDAVETATLPLTWAKLAARPYPRLGRYMSGGAAPWVAQNSLAASVPSFYTVDRVEGRLAFNDILAGFDIANQSNLPDSVRRLLLLNPDLVLLPYHAAGQPCATPVPRGSDVNLNYRFLQGVPDIWYVRDSQGNYVPNTGWPSCHYMNLSSYCPVANGQTPISYTLKWLNESVFPSGIWDGLFFDLLFGSADVSILNYNNPAMIDFDFNRNRLRDESPAAVGDVTRNALRGMVQQLREVHGDRQLILGNSGIIPELSFAPYVNGYSLECFNYGWTGSSGKSASGWRQVLDAYRLMQAAARKPALMVPLGCGKEHVNGGLGTYRLPNAEDIEANRFALSTALLGDGFYAYALHGASSDALWYDEFSVDSSGSAVEDRSKKGYLGQAISDAVELATTGSLVLEQGFEGAALPASFTANPGPGTSVRVSHAPDEVIGGSGSLVLDNPDHTKQQGAGVRTNPQLLQLTPLGTYLLTFDWRILESLDSGFGAAVSSDPAQPLALCGISAKGAGDSGRAHCPFAIPSAGAWSISFYIANGGGKVALDNVRVFSGGIGPWRRDFENGFVLVNPFEHPHTFLAGDLAGGLTNGHSTDQGNPGA